MSSPSFVLTAGFDRAANVAALAELLHRRGHTVAGILVVSPFNLQRVRKLTRQRGKNFPIVAARRLLGRGESGGTDPLVRFLEEEKIEERSLKAWASAHGADYCTCSDLNAPEAVELVARLRPDGVIYGGGGGILKQPFISAAEGRILNAHSGPLPEIRGMNAAEWSLLLGLPAEMTIHVIDEGIDTGPVLETIPIDVEPDDDVETLRSKCAVLGVQGLVRASDRIRDLPESRPGGDLGLQCFVLAPALRELLDAKLARGDLPAGGGKSNVKSKSSG